MRTDSPLSEQLLDQALCMAEEQDWDSVQLHQLAERCGVSLAALQRCYRQKDELVDAWLNRADQAMLAEPHRHETSSSLRLEQALIRWLSALAPHRELTRQMLGYKLEPGHLHLQLRLVTRLSRTVQW